MMRIAQPVSSTALALHHVCLSLNLYKFLAGIVLGIGFGYLVVAELWIVALALVAALPAFIVLHKNPLLGFFIWLALAQFLMITETMALRMLYWMVHRALPPATVGFIVLSSMFGIHDRKLAKLRWPDLAMIGYLAATQVSIVYLSQDAVRSTIWLYDRVFVPMCLYLIIRLLAPGEEAFKRLAPIALFICLVQSVVGMLSWAAPSVLPAMWHTVYLGSRAVGTLDNPGVYTDTMAFVGLFVLHAGLSLKTGWTRVLYIVAFLMAEYSIFISFTRSSWLGAIIIGIGLTVLYPRFMLTLLLVVALVVGGVGGVLLADQFDRASQRLYSEQSEESALSRLPIYYAAIRMFLAKPLFGWGFSNFDRYDRDFQARVGDLVNPEKDHASHNLYLTILSEQGGVGLALYITPLIWWFLLSIKAWPAMRSEGFWSRRLLVILWLAVAYYVVINNFFNVIVVYGLGLWWITLALIATLVLQHLKEQDDSVDVTRERLLRRYHEEP